MAQSGRLISSRRQVVGQQMGQATIEFALTVILILSAFLFFFQVAMTFAIGNYVHYATFLSARAYLAGGPTEQDQEQRATAVAARMLQQEGRDRFRGFSKGGAADGSDSGAGAGDVNGLAVQPPGEYQKGVRAYSWLQGVRYRFRSRIFILPMGRSSSQKKDSNLLELTSESWLGRETSYEECVLHLKKVEGAIFDNGC